MKHLCDNNRLNLDEIMRCTYKLRCKTGKELDITFLYHPYDQALLKTAVLASISPPFIHRTVFVCQTNVFGVFLHRALKETAHVFGVLIACKSTQFARQQLELQSQCEVTI